MKIGALITSLVSLCAAIFFYNTLETSVSTPLVSILSALTIVSATIFGSILVSKEEGDDLDGDQL
jgi:hypothetical protein